MTYRDRPVQCPRCSLDLVRLDARDQWRCHACRGTLVGLGELTTELVRVAPDLMPSAGARGVSTLGRRTEAPLLKCGVCGQAMEPVFLGGVEIDRCDFDGMFWFDARELGRVLAIAIAQRDERSRTWTASLSDWLFG